MKELERKMLNNYGDYNKAVDKAEDIGLISAVIAMFVYIAVLAYCGIQHIFPVATTVIGKVIGFYAIMLSAAAVACGIGLLVRLISAKYVYRVQECYDKYLTARRELRHEQRKEEEET